MRSAIVFPLALVLVFAVAPRPALAQQGGSGLQLAGEGMVVILATPVVLLGGATDLILGVELANTGHARLVWSITGTATWSLLTLGAAAAFYGGPQASASLKNPGAYLISAVCLGSLAWSIYGITRHPPAVTVTPTALATPHGGLAPGVVIAGRW